VCVRRHVVEPGPRILDRRALGEWKAPDEPLDAVVEERFVHRGVEGPTRLGVGHRENEPVAAAAEMEAGLRLDHHRQLGRQLR